ncbi:unnamed protein product [Tuber aestivum]|uniref:Uncharacterized protein n=1 Tax=Tuber aestivum TaxID=59557 RepID=A0A292PXV2_9PEZI|nr:unnamed protein product [Tuber aestivum]
MPLVHEIISLPIAHIPHPRSLGLGNDAFSPLSLGYLYSNPHSTPYLNTGVQAKPRRPPQSTGDSRSIAQVNFITQQREGEQAFRTAGSYGVFASSIRLQFPSLALGNISGHPSNKFVQRYCLGANPEGKWSPRGLRISDRSLEHTYYPLSCRRAPGNL